MWLVKTENFKNSLNSLEQLNMYKKHACLISANHLVFILWISYIVPSTLSTQSTNDWPHNFVAYWLLRTGSQPQKAYTDIIFLEAILIESVPKVEKIVFTITGLSYNPSTDNFGSKTNINFKNAVKEGNQIVFSCLLKRFTGLENEETKLQIRINPNFLFINNFNMNGLKFNVTLGWKRKHTNSFKHKVKTIIDKVVVNPQTPAMKRSQACYYFFGQWKDIETDQYFQKAVEEFDTDYFNVLIKVSEYLHSTQDRITLTPEMFRDDLGEPKVKVNFETICKDKVKRSEGIFHLVEGSISLKTLSDDENDSMTSMLTDSNGQNEKIEETACLDELSKPVQQREAFSLIPIEIVFLISGSIALLLVLVCFCVLRRVLRPNNSNTDKNEGVNRIELL